MNSQNKTILNEFRSRENVEYLAYELKKYFNNTNVDRFLDANMSVLVSNFIKTAEKQLYTSKPIVPLTTIEQVKALNKQFMNDRISFIQQTVSHTEQVEKFVIGDGNPTSRYGLSHYQSGADDILKSWNNNSGRQPQYREDPSNIYAPTNSEDQAYTGITYCDQSEIGTSNHTEMFYTNAIKSMNQPRMYDGAFAHQTPESDARLLSRNIFRSEMINGKKVENAIPLRQAALHRRNLERNVSEGMRGTEKEYIQYAHDMSSLYKRTDEEMGKYTQYC